MAFEPHQFPVEVTPADIDFMGHVNNAIYLKWIQDAVIDHWHAFAPSDAVRMYVWVALKHEITYRKPAFLADRPIVVVRLERVRRESAFYEATVVHKGEVLAEGRSRWCCLDAETLKPTRLPDDIISKFT